MNSNFTPLDTEALAKRQAFSHHGRAVFWMILIMTVSILGSVLYFMALKYHVI